MYRHPPPHLWGAAPPRSRAGDACSPDRLGFGVLGALGALGWGPQGEGSLVLALRLRGGALSQAPQQGPSKTRGHLEGWGCVWDPPERG